LLLTSSLNDLVIFYVLFLVPDFKCQVPYSSCGFPVISSRFQ
jgi:hypothetical protein